MRGKEKEREEMGSEREGERERRWGVRGKEERVGEEMGSEREGGEGGDGE